MAERLYEKRYDRPSKKRFSGPKRRAKAPGSGGGRTPSEAGLAQSMAELGNKVSKSNQRVGAPATTPDFGTPRPPAPRKARRSSDVATRPNAVTGLSDRAQERTRIDRTSPAELAVAALDTAKEVIERDAQRSARIVSDPDSTVADRVAALAPPVGPNAGTRVGAGLKLAQQLERAANRGAKINKARKAGQAVKAPKETAKQTAEKAKNKASKAGKKAKRIRQKASQPGGKAQIAKDTAKATGRGAGKVAKGAGSKAANSRVLPLASSPVIADEAGLSGEAIDKGSALVKGAVTAPVSDPIKYTATTGRGILGMGAGFGLGAYALGNTVVRGARGGPLRPVPGVGADYSAGEVVEPVTDLAKQEWEGTKEIGKKLLSGDQEVVEQTFVDDLGGIMFIPGPAIARKIKNSDKYRDARSKARDRASEKVRRQREEAAANAAKTADQRPKANRKGRDKPQKKPRSAIKDPMNPGEEYLISNAPVVRSLGGRAVANKIKRRNIRKGVSGTADMETQIAARETVLDDKDVQADIMGISAGPTANRNAWLAEAERAAFVAANRGIPFDREGGLAWIDEIEASKTPETYEVGGVRESRVLDWIRDNPEVLSDPSFQSAVRRVTGLLDSTTTSQRAKFLPVARVAGIKTPEERLAEGVWVGGEPRTVKREVLVDEALTPEQRAATASALARKNRRDERRAGIAARRTERRRATRQSKNYDTTPEAINQREWYQGSSVEGLSPSALDPDVTNPTNLFGPGIYLTTSPKVARGYGKARTGKGKRGKPQLYRAKVQVKNPLDMDAPLDPRFRDILISFAERMEKNPSFEELLYENPADNPAAIARKAAQKDGATNASLYSTIRNEISYAARDAGWNAWELDAYFSDLRGDLISQGWDSLTHRGGKRTGGRDHQTLILLDPNPASVPRFGTRSRPIGPEPRPMDQVPRTRKGRRVREEVVVPGRRVKETTTDPRAWERAKADLKDYRAEARAAEARGDTEAAIEARARAKTLERRIRNFELGYRKAGKDFIAETEAFIAERGLRTPARMTDKKKDVEGLVDKFGNAAFGRRRQNSRASHLSEGKNLARDVADRSREGAWNDSILGPRLQRVFHGLTKGVIAEYGYKITTRGRNGKPRKVLEGTSREHQAALERGELPEDAMLIDAQYYRAAIGDKNAGTISFDDFLAAVGETQGRIGSPRFGIGRDTPENPPVMSAAELRRMGREDRANEPGKKYIAVDREAMMELVGQIEGIQGGTARQFARLNRGTSNVILGLNPSFIGAQQVAEGGPAVTAALTANPVALARMARTAPNRSRGTNRQRAQREAMYGISGGTYQFRPQSRGSVIDRVDQLTEPRLTKPSKALGLLKDAFKGRAVNQTVLRTGAAWRRLAGLGEIDRRTLRTAGSLGGLVTRFNSLERKFKGKSLAEVEDYMAANPKLRNEIRAYMDDVMGNFSTLTRLEARFAPGIAFYPYLRYSLKWGFFSFPRRHPMRASILYFLGQVNAEELEKLVDNGKVADWIDNSFPVASKDGEPYPLPGGSRFAPSGSGIFQSLPFIGEGDPDRAIGVLNPGAALILNSVLGRDSFDGDKVAEEWWERVLLGAASLQAMVSPIRALDEADENIPGLGDIDPITGIKPRRTWDGVVIGEPSVSGQEFDALDPNRIERGLAPWGPLIGQSARDYRKTNRKARKMKRNDYSSSSSKSNDPSTPNSPFSVSPNNVPGNPFR